MNKIIHSFNTRPLTLNMYGYAPLSRMFGMIWYYALSLAYARRLGLKADLYADSFGAALLAHLPYDNIYTSLDEIPEDMHPRIWAVGKAFALRDSEPGAVHIDGDVFIKTDKCAQMIFESDWDVIVQYREPECYYSRLSEILSPCSDYFTSNGLRMKEPGAFNTGIVGFRDVQARDRYCLGWIDNALYISKKQHGLLDKDDYITVDIMLEQKYIAQVAKEFKDKVYILLDNYGNSMNDFANSIGFQHVLTADKFKALDKCRRTLRLIDTQIYTSTLKICRKY